MFEVLRVNMAMAHDAYMYSVLSVMVFHGLSYLETNYLKKGLYEIQQQTRKHVAKLLTVTRPLRFIQYSKNPIQ